MEFFNTDFLENDEIKLVLERTDAGDPVRNWVPAYHFRIFDRRQNQVGQCDLRIGYNENLFYGGHIGYRVEEAYRGHRYAAKACRLLFLLAKKHGMAYLYITCNPDNLPSRRTCESLDGEFLGEVTLPADNDMRVNDGETEKCVFRFQMEA